MGKTLGTGTFGKVKLAQRLSDGQMVAIKCLNRSRLVLTAQVRTYGHKMCCRSTQLKCLNRSRLVLTAQVRMQ